MLKKSLHGGTHSYYHWDPEDVYDWQIGAILICALFQRSSLGLDITVLGFTLCPVLSSSATILFGWVRLPPQGPSFGAQAVL